MSSFSLLLVIGFQENFTPLGKYENIEAGRSLCFQRSGNKNCLGGGKGGRYLGKGWKRGKGGGEGSGRRRERKGRKS